MSENARQLPTSRWQGTAAPARRDAAGRVRRSHAQTRVTVGIALGFVVAAAIAALAGAGAWLVLHLFLAGGAVLLISGVSLMLTVTWSAAPAPRDGAVMLQRLCVAVGAAGVAAGRELDAPVLVVGVAGGVYVLGLVGLAVMLVTTVRRGVNRRFDAAVAAYVAALTAGCVGVGIGVMMVTGTWTLPLRHAHMTLNLLGLVGIVIGGTFPYFAATVGRSRMAPHATPNRLYGAVCWQTLALTTAVIGFATVTRGVVAAGLVAYAIGIGALLWLSPRLTRRQLQWAGPRLIAMWAGASWWIVSVVAMAIDVAGDRPAYDRRWVFALVVAGYAQIIWGSLAYLLAMLRGGGHERLSEGFAATRSWVGLAAANVAGLCFVVEAPMVARVALAVWIVDAGIRARRVQLGRRLPS